jgi:hypothetical protein
MSVGIAVTPKVYKTAMNFVHKVGPFTGISGTPPVRCMSDTAILEPHAGTTFLVVRAGVSSLGELPTSAWRFRA